MSDEEKGGTSAISEGEAHRTKTVEAASWAFLLIWLGVTTLFSLEWPVFLVGLGVLVLALQGLRHQWGLGTENFWMILGVVFVVAGIAETFGTGIPLGPLALILFGLAALYDVYKRMSDHHS